MLETERLAMQDRWADLLASREPESNEGDQGQAQGSGEATPEPCAGSAEASNHHHHYDQQATPVATGEATPESRLESAEDATPEFCVGSADAPATLWLSADEAGMLLQQVGGPGSQAVPPSQRLRP